MLTDYVVASGHCKRVSYSSQPFTPLLGGLKIVVRLHDLLLSGASPCVRSHSRSFARASAARRILGMSLEFVRN